MTFEFYFQLFNTTDDEDEGSTPSGDNAERSLASTLGGSTESIPQQSSSSFLQAALDGPGLLSERGERSEHNNLPSSYSFNGLTSHHNFQVDEASAQNTIRTARIRRIRNPFPIPRKKN